VLQGFGKLRAHWEFQSCDGIFKSSRRSRQARAGAEENAPF